MTTTVNGVTFTFGKHFYDNRERYLDRNFTKDEVGQVLKDWVAFGICWDGPEERGRRRNYWGYIPNHRHMLTVVVELEENEIVTAFLDGKAARRLTKKDEPGSWFSKRCIDLEVRDEG